MTDDESQAEGHAELIRRLWELVDEWRAEYPDDWVAWCAGELALLLPPR